jgi:hypothetical protein
VDRLPWNWYLLLLWVLWASGFVLFATMLEAFSGWIWLKDDLTTRESVENWRVTGRPLYRDESLYRWR